MQDRVHMMRHALKQANREIRQADRDIRRTCRQVLREQRGAFRDAGLTGAMGMQAPYTTETVLEEIDSYISYLEDLPAEQVQPHLEKLDRSSDRLAKLRDSFKK